MPAIKDTMTGLIKAREKKIVQMETNFEPTARIVKYKKESLDTIKSTYRDLIRRTRDGLDKAQAEIKAKYDISPMSADERTRMLIRYAALPTSKLLDYANGVLSNPDLPIDAESAFIIGKELRTRGKNTEADSLAYHAVEFLEKPWVKDESYRSVEGYKKKCDVFEANADRMLVLSLDPKAAEGDIYTIDKDEVVVTTGRGGV